MNLSEIIENSPASAQYYRSSNQLYYKNQNGTVFMREGGSDLGWMKSRYRPDDLEHADFICLLEIDHDDLLHEEMHTKPDNVNHPKHYQLREGYEVYDLRQDLARKAELAEVRHAAYSDWDRALEYLLRMWDKNGKEDAKKARWYLDKLIEKMEE